MCAASRRQLFRHALPALACAVLAVVWSFPLVTHLSNHLPGDGVGDNATFAWNVWWMREALAHPGWHVFQTDRLFAPFGVDLTLHTHTALPAFAGATLLRSLPPITAQNVLILVALWLNAFAAYLLAVDRTGDRAAAMLAAIVFGGSPYVFLHLLGHFNLIHAWVVPLFTLWLFRAADDGRARAARMGASALAGVMLVVAAYTDYYYLVYCCVLAAGVVIWPLFRTSIGTSRRRVARPLGLLLGTLLVLDTAAIVAILVTGGFTFRMAGRAVTASSVTNPLSVAWLVVIVWVWARYRPALHRTERREATAVPRLSVWLPMILVSAAGVLPLAMRGFSMWMRGDYVTAAHSWRSGPGGVDLATLVLGSPLHPLWGSWTSSVYARLDIDRIEKCAWLGVVPLALFGWTLVTGPFRTGASVRRDRRLDRDTRRWATIGAVFFVWALGPWLRIAGVNSGLPLPQHLLQFIPVVANARMPGRAMVVVMMAVAVICAIAVAKFSPSRRRLLLPVLMVGAALDFLALPFPVVDLGPVPAYAAALSGQRDGAVVPLPLGWRDGYGETGHFDGRSLIDQFTHGHPLAGGFVARLPPSTADAYRGAPVLRSLLLLSEGKPAAVEDLSLSADESAAALVTRGIRFIALDRRSASGELVAYLRDRLPTRLVTADPAGRDLYEIVSRSRP